MVHTSSFQTTSSTVLAQQLSNKSQEVLSCFSRTCKAYSSQSRSRGPLSTSIEREPWIRGVTALCAESNTLDMNLLEEMSYFRVPLCLCFKTSQFQCFDNATGLSCARRRFVFQTEISGNYCTWFNFIAVLFNFFLLFAVGISLPFFA